MDKDSWKPEIKKLGKNLQPPLPERRYEPTRTQRERIESLFATFVTEHLHNFRGLHLSSEEHDRLQASFNGYIQGDISKDALKVEFSDSFLRLPMKLRDDARIKTMSLQPSIDAFDRWREQPTPVNAGIFGATLSQFTMSLEQRGLGIDPNELQAEAFKGILSELLASVPPEAKTPPQKPDGPRLVPDFNNIPSR